MPILGDFICEPAGGLDFALSFVKQAPPIPFEERCPPRQKSRVERLTAKVEPLLTSVTVENFPQKKIQAFRIQTLRAGRRACLQAGTLHLHQETLKS